MSTTENIAPKAIGAKTLLDDQSKAKLQKAVRDFESVIVGYMLKSMRSSMSETEMFGDSLGGDVMEGMFDTELARQMSRNSSFGLGEMLYREMTGEELPKPVRVSAAKGPAQPIPATPAPSPAGQTVPPSVKKIDNAETAVTSAPAVMSDKSELVMPKPQPQVRDSLDQKLQPYESMIASAAKDHDLNPSLLKAVIASESGGNARAVSSKHAKGLMQLVDTTAAAMGVQNVWDPEQNIQGGAKYLQSLLDRFGGNIAHAVASYNAGPAAVEKHGGIPPFKETRAYVDKVLKYLQHFEQQGIASNDQD